MNVLDTIVAHKREEVAVRRGQRPHGSLDRSTRSFERALGAPGLSLIAEIKDRAPSVRERPAGAAPFDVARLARAYDRSARAISVLTDERFFGGSHAHLAQAVRESRRPVLCKDFVVDPDHQIPEARAHGADAILLMAQVLAPRELERALGIARSLGMEALVETHDEEQLERVLFETSARIVGVNARDLRTLAIDLERPLRMAERARAAGRLVVAESGLRSRQDVERLEGHVDAILVGSAFSMAPDPVQALRALGFSPRAERVAVKVCGVRTAAQASAIVEAGASAIGLNFVPGARRAVTLDEAARIAALELTAERVGVFVRPSASELSRTIRAARLDAVQVHGELSLSELEDLAREARREGVALWRAIEVREASSVREELARAADMGARVLLDGPRSGSGQRLDADVLRGLVLPSDLVLAGGLTAQSVAVAIEAFEPSVVDVASGIERDGAPCPERVRDFVSAASARGVS